MPYLLDLEIHFSENLRHGIQYLQDIHREEGEQQEGRGGGLNVRHETP